MYALFNKGRKMNILYFMRHSMFPIVDEEYQFVFSLYEKLIYLRDKHR